MLDTQVTHFMSRDLDSVIQQREVDAVNEWLKSSKSFHVMRDHPYHFFEMLGGMWGVKQFAEEKKAAMISLYHAANSTDLWSDETKWGPDQIFLKKYIWPWARKNSLSHDSYTCEKFPGSVPFPSQRNEERWNFVASLFMKESILKMKCPLACRKFEEWIFC